MRLIDADKFEVVYSKTERTDEAYVTGYIDGMHDALEMVDAAPTVDTVPVVRCRECKWGKKTSKEGIFYHCGYPYEQTGEVHLPNWYCPGGARKEDTK